MAMKIAGRAMRRCGALLKEIEPAKPGPVPVRELDAGAGTQFGSLEKGRTAAAQAAGLSHRQQHQAIRIANVPAPVFEEMIERPKPATLTELADVGKKTAPRPAPSIAHLHGADPKDY